MHLHELLDMSITDYEVERARIELLLFRTTIEGDGVWERYCYRSLADLVNGDFIRSRVRGTATDISEFFASYAKYWKTPSLEGLLLYCELVWNVLYVTQKSTDLYKSSFSLATQISKNIRIILEKTGHEIRQREDMLYEIIRKDALASAAIADLQDRDAASAVLDYSHFRAKGDLARKRELLVVIGRHVEPLLDDPQLKNEQRVLVDDVGFCLNNLNIRHNNEEGKNAKPFVARMPDTELEEWYDRAYRSMLLLIEHKAHLETHGQIAALKTQLRTAKKPEISVS